MVNLLPKLPSISVIVTTYNWSLALDLVLQALCQQDYPVFEIIVADDGSTDDTAKIVQKWQAKTNIRLIHCWQPDEGFRAAMIRNRASALAQYDYLIFLDGDCIPFSNFLYTHAKLAEKGWLVAGNRVLLSQALSEKMLSQSVVIKDWHLFKWIKVTFQGDCNRFLPLITLPFYLYSRKRSALKWQGAKTCNLGLWKEDFFKVNGLEEAFVGWGFEDSDLIIRLQRAGILRKCGKFAVGVLHLWHEEQSREQEAINQKRLALTLESKHIKASSGTEQYVNTFPVV